MHFFIDHNLPQAATDGFGPESSDPTNKFNITTLFQLSAEKKAFACQTGLVIVQESALDNTLVNVIIKPREALDIPLNTVKYYVYRGILKSSFIDGTAVSPQSSSNSEFIARFWIEWNAYKTKKNLPNLIPSPKLFGFDTSLANSVNVETIYAKLQADVKVFTVNEGEWIGDFGITEKIGFEIIVGESNLDFDLEFLRAGFFQVDVTGLTGHQVKTKREQILSFIDPAAFFGLHYYSGVNISIYSGINKTIEKKKENEIYLLLLENKFVTQNTVYLDIRSEKGYSYNFYENYQDSNGKNLKIGNSANPPTPQEYSIDNWPIIAITSPLVTNEDKNDILISLRIDDNTKPLLFFENTRLISSTAATKFYDESELLIGTATDWSKELLFKFPNTGTGSAKNNVAYYIKMYYFRKEFNVASPPAILDNKIYFDSAFCPINSPLLGDVNYTFQEFKNPDYVFLGGQFPNTTNNFGFVGSNGAFWDGTRIVFYSQAVVQTQSSGIGIPAVPIIATDSGLNLLGDFFKKSFLFKKITTLSNKITETGVGDIEVLEVIHSSSLPSAKENLLILCLKNTEVDSLKGVTGLSDLHSKHMFIEELSGSPYIDANGVTFRKFKLRVQGLDTNGDSSILDPSPALEVYSKDGFTFSSKEFGDLENTDNKAKLSKIYGNNKVYEWRGYFDDSREDNVRTLVESTCVTIPSIFPSLLFTIALGEGLNLWLDMNYDPLAPNNILINNRISGFGYLGTDDFGSDFSRYSPFLPTTFTEGDEFDLVPQINELGQPVVSADFKDLESGLLGIGSVIAHRKNKFLTDASTLGYKNPNIDQIVYWTYVYYQGEGRAKKYLTSNKGFDFTKAAPTKMKAIRKLALERLATWRYMKIANRLSS